jgi:hypothetical protein
MECDINRKGQNAKRGMMRRFRIFSLTILCLLLLANCGIRRPSSPMDSAPTPDSASTRPGMPQTVQPGEMEIPFLAADVSRSFEPFQYLQDLSKAGILFFGAEKLYWNDFQADESSGYAWESYDSVMREIEAVGGDILPTIWSISTWAVGVPSTDGPASAPAPGYGPDYAAFIQAFMERYDHDGIDDMPGLRYAHDYLQIEDEAENLGDSWTAGPSCGAHDRDSEAYFHCAADEYGDMLALAYRAAHRANPDAIVLSFSFNFGDFFDANPEGLPTAAPFAENRLAFLDQVFTGYGEYFDVIAVQCNYDYPGIPPAVDYVRTMYRLEKPIVCSDAASIPLIGQQQSQPGNRFEKRYPFLKDSEILAILDSGASDPRYGGIQSWWEAEQSRLSVKKAVVSADAGVEQIGFQFVMTGFGCRNNPWTHAYLLSAGPAFGNDKPAGTARPVVFALGQLSERIPDFHSVENLNPIPPGTDPDNWLWMYRFAGADRPVCVIWSGSGKRTANLEEYLASTTARITPIVTALDRSGRPVYPPGETFPADSIPVDETPLLVE